MMFTSECLHICCSKKCMTFTLQSYEINPKNKWNCFGNHVFYNTLSFPKAYVIKFFLFYADSRQILQIIRENFGGMENSSYLCKRFL